MLYCLMTCFTVGLYNPKASKETINKRRQKRADARRIAQKKRDEPGFWARMLGAGKKSDARRANYETGKKNEAMAA